jgi:hypothetical protein
MASWTEVALDAKQAAEHLLARKKRGTHARSACSRAYYAAYAAVASVIPAGAPLSHGANPSHAQLPGLVNGLARYPLRKRRAIREALSRLYKHRIDADYGPTMSVGDGTARNCLRDCALIFSELGIGQ